MALICSSAFAITANAQELNCTVEVNSQSVQGTDKSVFTDLQEAMTEYLNNRKWTNTQISPNEKIDCRFFLTVKEYDSGSGNFKGDLQVQLSRPVYNSTYTTTLFNFKDNKIEFEWKQGEPLTYNENNWESELTGLLNYYAYMFLALDFDSFSPRGGQAYFDKAASIVQMAQSSGGVGWKTFEDTKNRSAVLSSFTETASGAMRDLLYDYHRRGLDEMVTSPDKGRAAITETIGNLKKIYDVAPMSVALSIFKDSKLDELVNVYSQAPETERTTAYDLLQPIFPTDTERLNKIKNGQQ